MCPARLELARELRDQGQLLADQIEMPPPCWKCTTHGGRVNPCAEHLNNPPVPVRRKGRPPGSGRKSKLTPAQCAEIIKRHAAGGITLVALAAEYGVSDATIGKIVKQRQPSVPGQDVPVPGQPAVVD
jgi:hypothetical protein